MIFCADCSRKDKVIHDGDKCYQVRYGNWNENDAQDLSEFEAKEDVAYYHEEFFILHSETVEVFPKDDVVLHSKTLEEFTTDESKEVDNG